MRRGAAFSTAAMLMLAGAAQAGVFSGEETSQADAYIYGGSPSANTGNQAELLSKNDTVTNSRKIYFRVDASDMASVTNASVALRVLQSNVGNVGTPQDYHFNIYGLRTDFSPGVGELDQTWGETAITWNNAPGNDTASGSSADGADIVLLGQTTPGVSSFGTTGQTVQITGDATSNLVSFLRSAAVTNPNGWATFIAVRNEPGTGTNSVVHKFASKEYTPAGGSVGDWAPRVAYNETIAHEPFAYTPTPQELHGKNGGTGFSNSWNASTSFSTNTDVVSPASHVIYTQGGIHNHGGATALQITGTSESTANRSLVGSHSGDVFVSFMVRWDAGSVNNNDFLSVALGANDNVSIGVKGNRGNGSGTEDFYVRLSGAGSEQFAGEVTLGETTFLVGRLFKSTGTGNYDRLSLWVNPDLDDELTPLATATGTSDRSAISMTHLRAVFFDADDLVMFDELRFGTTWRSVVPAGIPEPTGVAMLLVTAACLRARRRR